MIVVSRLYDLLKGDYTGPPYSGFYCCNNLFGVLVYKGGRERTCDEIYYEVKRIVK